MTVHGPHLFPFAFGIVISCFFLALFVWPYWRIFAKAGFPGALSLLMLIPVVNIVMIYVLAFSRWKTLPSDNPTYLPPNDTLLR